MKMFKKACALLICLTFLFGSFANAQEQEFEIGDFIGFEGMEVINGELVVLITVPASLVTVERTQAELDAFQGENYVAAKLNEDGSITYKFTKEQHKQLIDNTSKEIESVFADLINDPNYDIVRIIHDETYSKFDIYLSAEEISMNEMIAVMYFYSMGAMHNVFSGNHAEFITVNWYSKSGVLLHTSVSESLRPNYGEQLNEGEYLVTIPVGSGSERYVFK